VCEVTDQGGGVQDPLAGFVPPKPSASAGMGLWIARQLSDSFAIGADDEGTTVRIAVDR
jgi:anti-sigma regulatory factor (Ser/Thr protein kinase)